jgi:UDP-N-acetylmuramoyl-tripeptide--D-alanyl-D-alanine ligase
MTVIDDSFNANIEGAKIALEVLSSFLQKKVVITAGLVDMGKRQKDVNIELGRLIADTSDWCIITGPNSLYIYEGLIEQNFSVKNIRVCDSLNQAVKVLNSISGSKVVLFQNDLPDNY